MKWLAIALAGGVALLAGGAFMYSWWTNPRVIIRPTVPRSARAINRRRWNTAVPRAVTTRMNQPTSVGVSAGVAVGPGPTRSSSRKGAPPMMTVLPISSAR